MINTIIFDLDGTLTTSPDIIIEGYSRVVKKYFPDVVLSEDEKTEFMGRTLKANFEIFTKDEKLMKEMELTYRTITNNLSKEKLNTYPNAENVVKYLIEEGVKVGIVTSKSYEVALMDLKTVGLDKYFDVLVGYEQTDKHKPEPDSLNLAMKMLKSKPEETIYVGDHENDIIAAHRAKMQSVLVTYSYRLEQGLRENPTYIVDDLEQIKDIV